MAWLLGGSQSAVQARAGYLFVSLSVLLIALFTIWPVVMALYLSLTNYDVLSRQDWVGFSNYQKLWNNELFWRSLENTAIYAFGTIPVRMAIALTIAVALNRSFRGRSILLSLYYVPVVTATVAIAIVWQEMYDPNYGAMNHILSLVGLPRIGWLGDPNWAMFSIILTSVWRNIGTSLVIFLAGLQGIPEQYYEAAQIDGAGRWHQFIHLTWPLLQPTTFFIFVTSTIAAFQVFEQVLVMTNGGPASATTTVVHQVYNTAFQSLQMGYASAMAFALFLVILSISMINVRLFRSDVQY